MCDNATGEIEGAFMYCGECAKWTPNLPGENVANLCSADMCDDDCQNWFVRVGPLDECHRPLDFEPVEYEESYDFDY